MNMESFTPQDIRYLKLLRKQYRTIQEASAEVAHLRAVLRLPKGTEHFLSDLHGEHQAFLHILHNASGVIKQKINDLYGNILSTHERDMLSTLIYYPDEKLALLKKQGVVSPEWYRLTIYRLVEVCRRCSVKYTRKRVRDAMPREMGALIEELMLSDNTPDKEGYYKEVMQSILETDQADAMIIALSRVIQALAIDRLHIIGDIFDRGPRADLIMDALETYHQVDVQWGNHDIVWMGAAAGSYACLAAVIRNNIHYDSLKILESAYGVSLRELALFAEATYRADDGMSPVEKAISVILFKLEGQTIRRHPNWHLDDRLLLEHVDAERGVAVVDGREYELRTRDFPTLEADDPYALTPEEQRVMDNLMNAVRSSDKLRRHVGFLFEHGSTYLVHNGNVLFHACVPMNEDGSFCAVNHQGQMLSGRAYYDYADRLARRAWHEHDQVSLDWMWYLWCGRFSPLSGRVVKTFERTYFADRSTWEEPRDPYFSHTEDPAMCARVLEEFGADVERVVIINGHTPVHAAAGESPVKAGGRLVVIDGGFCQAYHSTTGIAGYTLIADPEGMRIKAHRPFGSIADVLDLNADIVSDDDRFQRNPRPLFIGDTDTGADIRGQIADLRALLDAYRTGEIPERTGA